MPHGGLEEAAEQASPKNRRLRRLGGYPSRSLADPDVPNPGIRLLRSIGLLHAYGRMHDLHPGKRVLLQEAGKTLPVYASALGAAVQRCLPEADDRSQSASLV